MPLTDAAAPNAIRSAICRVQPDGAFGGAPENDAGLGGLLGQAQEWRRRDSDAQGRLTVLRTARKRIRDLLHVTAALMYCYM